MFSSDLVRLFWEYARYRPAGVRQRKPNTLYLISTYFKNKAVGFNAIKALRGEAQKNKNEKNLILGLLKKL